MVALKNISEGIPKSIIDELKGYIRDVPDFPKPGIVFKDFTPLIENARAFSTTVDLFAKRYRDQGIDKVVAVESRGFIIGSPLAYAIQAGCVIVRKPGKLPFKKDQVDYQLEYGKDRLEMHHGAIQKGEKCLIIDDLLATGGTVGAVKQLVERQGGNIFEAAFIIELSFLKGREKLQGITTHSLIQY